MAPTQPELGHQGPGSGAAGLAELTRDSQDSVEQPAVVWSRLPGQSCKIPNRKALELETGKDK